MKYQFSAWILFFAFLIISVPGCVDLEFDEPPVLGDDPGLTATEDIAGLKALYAGTLTPITEDIIVKGIVVADDRGGNFFRSFILQDETGGIEVLINLTSAYNFYPVGREVYVRCKGLVLGNDSGIIQLGGYIYEEGGAQILGDIIDYNKHLVGGKLVGEPAPRVRTINELSVGDISTLVKLENVEFITADAGQTFADPAGRRSVNRTLTDCNGNQIVVRTSGYAIFAGELTPEGNGDLVAIYNVFGTTPQLFMREFEDAVMTADRCTGTSGKEELMSIQDLRTVFTGGTSTGPANKKIRGVVISDRTSENLDGRNVFIQDASAGIVVRFQSDHTFNLGDEVEVVVSNQELSEFRGLMQVNGVPNEFSVSMGAGTLPTPREATVQEILNNAEAWESTLVMIKGASLSGNTVFSGSVNVSDGTGTIPLFSSSRSNFAEQPVPSTPVDMTAIVSVFNDPQLVIRNINDVIAGSTGGDPEELSLAEVRTLFTGGTGSAPAGKKVRGVVISDAVNMNLTGRNLVLQDSSGGIVIRFSSEHSFALGEDLEINVSGLELSEYNGLLQINNVPLDRAKSFGNGTLPTPRTATVKEITDNLEIWESTLVKVEKVTISGSSTYSGSTTVTDATGAIVMYTRSQATFSGTGLPSGEVTLTAIVSQFNDAQVIIRNLDDVKSN